MLLVLLVMASSLRSSFNQLPPARSAASDPTDALYFTLSTMTTVGFGDVTPRASSPGPGVRAARLQRRGGPSLIRLYTTGRDRGGERALRHLR